MENTLPCVGTLLHSRKHDFLKLVSRTFADNDVNTSIMGRHCMYDVLEVWVQSSTDKCFWCTIKHKNCYFRVSCVLCHV